MIASIARRLLGIDVLQELKLLDQRQHEVIHRQRRELEESQLEALRSMRDLVLGWRLSIERPEVDLRDDLDSMYRDLSDQISKIEEHVLA